jgi:hypothetical protein
MSRGGARRHFGLRRCGEPAVTEGAPATQLRKRALPVKLRACRTPPPRSARRIASASARPFVGLAPSDAALDVHMM